MYIEKIAVNIIAWGFTAKLNGILFSKIKERWQDTHGFNITSS